MLIRPVLLYDGNCGFCNDWVGRLRRWDQRGAIDYLPAQLRADVQDLPSIPDEALDRAMHLVLPNGRVYQGARALSPLLSLLPGGALLAPILRVPGVQSLADRVYAWIAARRHRLGCSSSCGVGPSERRNRLSS
ncbi:MAG: thiol-disulfide oxidoreductase DCC family protein [Gemmatimonadales bacterium]